MKRFINIISSVILLILVLIIAVIFAPKLFHIEPMVVVSGSMEPSYMKGSLLYVKEEGKENNLVDLIAADPAFGLTKADIEKNLKPELYVGRAPRQVEVYLRDVVNPVLEAHKDESGVKAEINV